jgi:hypothetical protein
MAIAAIGGILLALLTLGPDSNRPAALAPQAELGAAARPPSPGPKHGASADALAQAGSLEQPDADPHCEPDTSINPNTDSHTDSRGLIAL